MQMRLIVIEFIIHVINLSNHPAVTDIRNNTPQTVVFFNIKYFKLFNLMCIYGVMFHFTLKRAMIFLDWNTTQYIAKVHLENVTLHRKTYFNAYPLNGQCR